MFEFVYFNQIITKSMDLDSWIRNKKLGGFVDALKEETNEVIEAYQKKDFENLKDELGDILSCWLISCKLAEEQGLFNAQDVINSAIAKSIRRRPYILENKKVDKDEAYRIWQEAKLKEKNGK
jgi:uncharacterized protein YabN with tetrapyrrole methylase and pyrophosphatase domain